MRRGEMKRAGEQAMRLLLLACALTSIACLLLITVYLILAGLPAIREIGLSQFLFGRTWDSGNLTDPQFGILPLLLTTVCGAAGAIALGVPLGLLTALFLAKAAPSWLAAWVRDLWCALLKRSISCARRTVLSSIYSLHRQWADGGTSSMRKCTAAS